MWFLIKQAVFLQQPKNILIKFITIKFPTFQNFFIFQGLLHIIKIQKVFIPRINLRQPVFIFTLQNNYLYTQQPLFFFLQKIFISLTTILTLYFFFFFRKILVLFTNFFRTLFFLFEEEMFYQFFLYALALQCLVSTKRSHILEQTYR